MELNSLSVVRWLWISRLLLGQQSETVTVQGEASQVETTTSEMSAQVGQSQMRELPLNGRDFGQLILLAPGVQQVTSSQNRVPSSGVKMRISVAGSRPEGQALLLDGAEIQTFWGRGAGNGITWHIARGRCHRRISGAHEHLQRPFRGQRQRHERDHALGHQSDSWLGV